MLPDEVFVKLRASRARCLIRWNPAVEQQAQDRIHRLGQYKPIHVTRFIISGTIEERILKLQVDPSIKVWYVLHVLRVSVIMQGAVLS